ncbi:MAG: hypothetical protein HQL19_05480 [Candidatus Omnitrophica bacterium]|nr:hypothetical protein [Candidatus Omnitrophota bacterium]
MKKVWVVVRDHLSARAEWWLLGLGVILRLKHLLENRSLWLDESWVAVNILGASFQDILAHRFVISEFPAPPLGFSLFEKTMTIFWGNGEASLRAYPCCCGILALVAGLFLFRRILARPAFLVAFGLFVILESLVYYSAELKQYSSDVLIAVLVFGLADQLFHAVALRKRDVLTWILLGAVAVWVSYSVIILLAVVAGLLLAKAFVGKGRAAFLMFIPVLVVWLFSIVILYQTQLSALDQDKVIREMWAGSMLTAPVWSWQAVQWLSGVVYDSFKNPAGFGWPVIGIFFFMIGVWAALRKDMWRALLFLAPFVVTLGASIAGKYPFFGRMLLFLIPAYLFFMVSGAMYLAEQLKGKAAWGRVLLVVILVAFPCVEAGKKFWDGRTVAENRQALDVFRREYRPGDMVFMDSSGQPPFVYYMMASGFEQKFPEKFIGVFDGKKIDGIRMAKFARGLIEKEGVKFLAFRYEYYSFDEKGHFQGSFASGHDADGHLLPAAAKGFCPGEGRVWLFLSSGDDFDEDLDHKILDTFDGCVNRVGTFEGKNVGLYLYDMPVKAVRP